MWPGGELPGLGPRVLRGEEGRDSPAVVACVCGIASDFIVWE